MYEGMLKRVAERCLSDLKSDDLVRVTKGFASAVEILKTVEKELNRSGWVEETCIYKGYIHKLKEHVEIELDFPLICDIAEGRRSLL